jgi:hypothetical protein
MEHTFSVYIQEGSLERRMTCQCNQTFSVDIRTTSAYGTELHEHISASLQFAGDVPYKWIVDFDNVYGQYQEMKWCNYVETEVSIAPLPAYKEFYESLVNSRISSYRAELPQLAYDAFSQRILSLKLGMNNLENASALVDVAKAVMNPKKIGINLLRRIQHCATNDLGKEAANLWLQYRYQYSTAISDFQTAIDYYYSNADAIMDDIYSVGESPLLRCGFRHADTDYHYQFRLVPKRYLSKSYSCNCIATAFDKLYVRLSNAGIQPSLKNFWDLVPYSFVIDWVLPIGDYLEHIDDERYIDAFDIVDTCESYKHKITDSSLGATIDVSMYTRTVGNVPASGELVNESPSLGVQFKRLIDGAALLISK